MEIVVVISIAAACLLAGFGVAYLWFRARPARQSQRVAELEAQLGPLREQSMRYSVLAAELEREASVLRGQLLETSNRASTLEERANHLQVRLEEERQQSAREIKLITEAQRAFEMSFKSLSADALRNNNQSFLELARASLAEFQQGAKGDLEKRQIAIDQLVAPVRASLEKVDEKIAALERTREQAYGEIRQQFTQMSA